MNTVEMEIAILRGSSELECRIDPSIFNGGLINHKPTTRRQQKTLKIYHEAKVKGKLHAFSCMTIDPSIKDGKLIYQKGLPPAVGLTPKEWKKILREYNPSRNTRQMTPIEYECKNLFLIHKFMKCGYAENEAWTIVCDNSEKIGHYRNSDNAKECFEPTGSREVCGFYDLGNVCKLLAEDPWDDESNEFWMGSGNCFNNGEINPMADMHFINDGNIIIIEATGVIAFD